MNGNRSFITTKVYAFRRYLLLEESKLVLTADNREQFKPHLHVLK